MDGKWTAQTLMFVTAGGSVISVKDVQPRKADPPTLVRSAA